MTNTGDAKTPEQRPQWPYTSFRTILNLVERIEQAQAIPPQIDRSFLGGSEGQKTQVLAALKFLGLVTDAGVVTDQLRALINKPKERPALWKELLAKHYPSATALAVTNDTQQALEKTFAPLQGETLRKAVTFYLHAAKYASHPVSRFFKIPSGFTRSKRTRPNHTKLDQAPPTNTSHPPASEKDQKSRYIELLMKKAESDTELDTSLLDRIERLLGYPTESVNEE